MNISTQSKLYKNSTQYSNMKNLPKIGTPSNNLNLNHQNLYDSATSFFNMTGKQLKPGTETTFSSNFFTRNYEHYLEKVKQRNKIYNSSLKTEAELNSLLFKLKKYYSEVIAINKKKEETLNFLKTTLGFEQFKLNQVIEFQDIELPDEKISVRNFNELKLTKNEVEIQLRNLMKEKQHLDDLIKNASEYFKTIEYMCEEEKNRFKEIKGETNIIEQRINNVSQYQKIVDYNIEKENIKLSEEKILDDKLGKGLEVVDEVNLDRKIKSENLNKMLSEKEKNVEELKNRLLEIKRITKLENMEYQNEIKKKIEKGKEFGENQKMQEKKIVEIIYCLYLIQNYFINEENFDRKKMMKSLEYKLLENKLFDIFLNKKIFVQGRNTNVGMPISPANSEKVLENNKFKLDNNDDKSINNKLKKSENDESEKEGEKKDKIENKKTGPSIFLTNLQKKLSVINIPLQILDMQKENGPKSDEIRSNSFRDKKTDIFIYMNKIEKRKKNINSRNKDTEKMKKTKSDSSNNNKINRSSGQNNSPINTNTNTNNNASKKLNEIEIPSLEEIKEKFALININKKTLFNYNNELTSKLHFYKLQFNQFHKKELQLEDQRSLYFQKASKVIEQNFLAFKQLVKFKPEINQFINKHREFIEKVKSINKKNKLKEMNKIITKMNPINNPEKTQVLNNERNNENNKYEINIQFSDNMDLLISSSIKIIMANRDFFMKCYDYLKQINSSLETITNIDKKDKIENLEDNRKIIYENLKLLSEEINELDELIQKINKTKIKDKIDLINYIKNLINYSQTDEELKKMFDINELNSDLLYNFYKDIEKNKIKSVFYKQFKLKGFPELDTEFNHFLLNSEETIKHFQRIANIVKELENNSQINKIISKRVTKTKKRTREMTKINTLNSTINKNGISKAGTELGKINNLRYLQQNHVFNGFSTMSLSINKDVSYSELEFMSGGKVDEDDIPDNYTKKKIRKIRKKRASSIEESIVNKLYSPFLKKTSYLRQLNKNMKGIKSMTTLNCQANHTLRKRKSEVDILTHQMYIYNNPLINPDKLANQTYNSLVGIAVRKHNKYKYDKNFLNPNLIY